MSASPISQPPVPTSPAAGSAAPAGPVAAPEGATPAAETRAPASRDGLNAPKAELPAFAVRLPETAVPGEGVRLGDLLASLAGALATDPGFAALTAFVQQRMLAALAEHPALAEPVRRLANSPAFHKLAPEVQAKVVELLARAAETGGDVRGLETLVRSSAFAALPETAQTALLEKLRASPDAGAQLLNGGELTGAQGTPFGPGAVETATMLQVAETRAPVETPGAFAIPLPGLAVAPDAGGAAPEAPPSPTSYAQLKRLVQGLRALPSWSPALVEATLARDGRALFRAMTLEPQTTTPETTSWLLVLDLRSDLDVPYRRFRGDVLPASLEPEAGDPPTFRLVDELPQQTLTFVFEPVRLQLIRLTFARVEPRAQVAMVAGVHPNG